jgi:hypothetical protein
MEGACVLRDDAALTSLQFRKAGAHLWWYKGFAVLVSPGGSLNLGGSKQRFGIWWLAFGYTLALHVLDEAGHDFLSVYNPSALFLRRFVPFFPVFTFRQWIGSLLCALTVWLALAPLAFRGYKWQKWLAIPVAVLAGIGNALGHILSSIYLWRFMPGVYSAPLILLSGTMLLRRALEKESVAAAE